MSTQDELIRVMKRKLSSYLTNNWKNTLNSSLYDNLFTTIHLAATGYVQQHVETLSHEQFTPTLIKLLERYFSGGTEDVQNLLESGIRETRLIDDYSTVQDLFFDRYPLTIAELYVDRFYDVTLTGVVVDALDIRLSLRDVVAPLVKHHPIVKSQQVTQYDLRKFIGKLFQIPMSAQIKLGIAGLGDHIPSKNKEYQKVKWSIKVLEDYLNKVVSLYFNYDTTFPKHQVIFDVEHFGILRTILTEAQQHLTFEFGEEENEVLHSWLKKTTDIVATTWPKVVPNSEDLSRIQMGFVHSNFSTHAVS